MNKAGGARSCYAGDKLPESTGDKLPAGEMDSTFLGRLLGCTGEVTPLDVRIPPGNNLRSRLLGMLVKNIFIMC